MGSPSSIIQSKSSVVNEKNTTNESNVANEPNVTNRYPENVKLVKCHSCDVCGKCTVYRMKNTNNPKAFFCLCGSCIYCMKRESQSTPDNLCKSCYCQICGKNKYIKINEGELNKYECAEIHRAEKNLQCDFESDVDENDEQNENKINKNNESNAENNECNENKLGENGLLLNLCDQDNNMSTKKLLVILMEDISKLRFFKSGKPWTLVQG